MNTLNTSVSVRTNTSENKKGVSTMNKSIASLVMTIAWSIRRNAAAEMHCKVSEVLFSECLKMAWAQVNGGNRLLAEYNAIEPEAMNRWLSNTCHAYAKRTIGKSEGSNDWDHGEWSYDSQLEKPAFDYYGNLSDNMGDYVAEAWEALLRRVNNPSKMQELAEKGKSLTNIVWDCCGYAVDKINGQNKRYYNRVTSFDCINHSGDDFSLLDILADEKAVDPADILSDAGLTSILRDFAASLDDINKYILSAKIRGLTEREMAAHLTANVKKMSNVAVHKRIVKMQAALREYLTA